MDESSEDALLQIKDKEYAASYKNSPKTLILVGVNFSKEERNIGTFVSEEWTANGRRPLKQSPSTTYRLTTYDLTDLRLTTYRLLTYDLRLTDLRLTD